MQNENVYNINKNYAKNTLQSCKSLDVQVICSNLGAVAK